MSVITKEPSKELIQLIKECGKAGVKLSESVEKVKTKAREEGFRDREIFSLLRKHLKEFMTPRQIKWIVIEKENKSIKRQLELKQDKPIQLTTKATVKDAIIAEPDIIEEQTQTFEDTEMLESPQDMKATINTQQTYIDKLEHDLEEKKEVQKFKGQLRVKVSVSQLYREILMMRNSNAIYTNVLIDVDKDNNSRYVRLEPI